MSAPRDLPFLPSLLEGPGPSNGKTVKAGQVRKPASHSSSGSQSQPPTKVSRVEGGGGEGEGRGGVREGVMGGSMWWK